MTDETESSTKTRKAASQVAPAGRSGRRELTLNAGLPQPQNSIRPSRQRTRELPATKPVESPEGAPTSTRERTREPATSAATAERLIPDHIRKRFVQVGHRYYFSDGAHAFTDRGVRLVTPSENTEVVKSLIAIAQARGWKEISVTGSERFRKEAWGAASALGLKVRGFTQTEFERAPLAKNLARQAPDSTGIVEQSPFSGAHRSADDSRPG